MKVVILSYNHPDLTERTITSVRSLLKDQDILLVHNGSRPEHQTRLTEKFPNLGHLCLPANRGFPGGANAGLRQAFQESDWVLFLTNDCQLEEIQIPQSQPGLIAPLIWARKKGRIDSLGGAFEISKAHLFHCKTIEDFMKAKTKYIPGTAFWIHREVYLKTKGFDESLEMFWEDVDLSIRAARLGFFLGVDPSTKVLHAIGKTTHKNPHYTTYLYQRNRKRISLKYSDSRVMVRCYLWKSWLSLGFRQLKQRNWQKLKLLKQAIADQ